MLWDGDQVFCYWVESLKFNTLRTGGDRSATTDNRKRLGTGSGSGPRDWYIGRHAERRRSSKSSDQLKGKRPLFWLTVGTAPSFRPS